MNSYVTIPMIILGLLIVANILNFYHLVDKLDLSKEKDRYKLEKYKTQANIVFSGTIATAVIMQIMIMLFEK